MVDAPTYKSWHATANRISESKTVFDSEWRNHRAIKEMLEHVTPEFAVQYLTRIGKEYPAIIPLLQSTCQINDSIGGPELCDLGSSLVACPTTVRYVYHACVVLTAIKKLKREINLVEVGCGYGGLAKVIDTLAPAFDVKIGSYCLYDLPHVQKLQKRYLTALDFSIDIQFGDCMDFGAGLPAGNWFLISAYGIGEFDAEIADTYLSTICPKTVGGFIVWNSSRASKALPALATQPTCESVVEEPLTGPHNRIITW